MKSFPKARKAVLFQRAVASARRREQTAAPTAGRAVSSERAQGAREQQERLRDAFAGKDAA